MSYVVMGAEPPPQVHLGTPFADLVTTLGAHIADSDRDVYRHGGLLVEVSPSGETVPLDRPRLLFHLGRVVEVVGGRRHSVADLDRDVTAAVLTAPEVLSMFSEVRAVRHAPWFRVDGSTITAHGVTDGTLLLAPDGWPPPATSPSIEDVDGALTCLGDLVIDFDFDGEASRATYVAELLTALLDPGVTRPLFVHDAAAPGSGKTLLALLTGVVMTGEVPAVSVYPESDDELRKVLTATLLASRGLLVLDEVPHVSGRSLAALATSKSWHDRLLGQSRTVSLPNTLTVVLAGNNVSVRGDLARRVATLRLVPLDAHPERRSGFTHPDLVGHVRTHRRDIISALLTLVAAWRADGAPSSRVAFGSFEEWSAVIGGIVEHFDLGEFMGNRAEPDEDDRLAAHAALLRAAHQVTAGREFIVRDIIADYAVRDAVATLGVFLPSLTKSETDAGRAQALGIAWRGIAERWLGGYRVVPLERDREGRRSWRVECNVVEVESSDGL